MRRNIDFLFPFVGSSAMDYHLLVALEIFLSWVRYYLLQSIWGDRVKGKVVRVQGVNPDNWIRLADLD